MMDIAFIFDRYLSNNKVIHNTQQVLCNLIKNTLNRKISVTSSPRLVGWLSVITVCFPFLLPTHSPFISLLLHIYLSLSISLYGKRQYSLWGEMWAKNHSLLKNDYFSIIDKLGRHSWTEDVHCKILNQLNAFHYIEIKELGASSH